MGMGIESGYGIGMEVMIGIENAIFDSGWDEDLNEIGAKKRMWWGCKGELGIR